MDIFVRIIYILWSVFAIGFGIILLLYREQFIKGNIRSLMKFYDKTHLFLIKRFAEEMDSTEQRIVLVVLGIVFIMAGILLLLKNI